MAQDTQFRTDQFNEQVRQASEARIDRSIESMGQSIGRFGESIIQQRQFGEQMDLRRDQFALTKQQAAVDLYFKQRRDEELRVMSAARAAKAAQGLQEGQLKLQAIQQSDATKHGVEMNKMMRQEAKLRLRGMAEQMGGEIDPATGEFKETPSEGGAPLPEGMKNYTRGAGLVWQHEGKYYTHDARRGGRRRISKDEFVARVGSATQSRQDVLHQQANVEADNLRARLFQFREEIELGQPGPEAQSLMRQLEEIEGGYGGRQGRRRKPPTIMERFNQAYRASTANRQAIETSFKGILGNAAKFEDPAIKDFINHLNRNTKNSMEAVSDYVEELSKQPGMESVPPEQILMNVIRRGAAGEAIEGLELKDGKAPAISYGQHGGKSFQRLYKGRTIPGEGFAPHGKDLIFDDDDAYYMINTYGPKWDAGLVVSEKTLESPTDEMLALATDTATRRLGTQMQRHRERGMMGRKKKASEIWKTLSIDRKLGFGKYVLSISKFDKYLTLMKDIGEPSTSESEIRRAKASQKRKIKGGR